MEIPYTVVLTKADKLNKTETGNRLECIYGELGSFAEGVRIVPFSAQNTDDGEKIRQIIEEII